MSQFHPTAVIHPFPHAVISTIINDDIILTITIYVSGYHAIGWPVINRAIRT
ncbi:hypothetical protein THIOM_000155 [Candidatus Thiomargarita nelsonii]|uniref:Uncharacterized protein n=1 Tax=Candidatus Thiomargarita nelsonii TaxID=1003181 RepID=A0A176S7P5_9GAMM|nr:hypothetical protein THIOM_000155 [Candidatus Thiomargarita nelsonii]